MDRLGIDYLEVEKNLYDSFDSFFNYSLELVKDVDKNKSNYKFAVVNMQITLELFLKYYFIRNRLSQYVVKEVNSNGIKYKDFSVVLNNYFSVNHWSYGRKKELTRILQLRNNIVHNGTNTQWDKEVIGYILRCVLFMHGVMNADFNESLVTSGNFLLKNNSLWSESVKAFIGDLAEKRSCFTIRTCLSCGEYTLIPKEVFEISEPSSSTIDDLVCLNCLEVYEMEFHNTIIDCYECGENSYFVELLNPQNQQQYVGICSECGTSTWVRKCAECEKLYHPSEENEVKFQNKYFCSDKCLESYKDCWSLE